MNFASQRDWEYFESLKREGLRAKMAAATPEQRLDEYAEIFETVVELRSNTGIDYRTMQLWKEKLAIRDRFVECYRELE